MLGGVLASVFKRTAEDAEIDEDDYYEQKQRRMERRLERGAGRSAAAARAGGVRNKAEGG